MFLALAVFMPSMTWISGLVGLFSATAAALTMRVVSSGTISRGVFGANGFLVGVAIATYTDSNAVVGKADGFAFSGALVAAHLCVTAAAAAWSAVITAAISRSWGPALPGFDEWEVLSSAPAENQNIYNTHTRTGTIGEAAVWGLPPHATATEVGAGATTLQETPLMQAQSKLRVARRRLAMLRHKLGAVASPQDRSSSSSSSGLVVTGLPALTLPFVCATLAVLASIAGVQSGGPLGSGAGGGAAVPGGIAGGDVGLRVFRLVPTVRPPWLPAASVVSAALSGVVNATAAEAAASTAAATALAADVWGVLGRNVSAGGCFRSSLPGWTWVDGGVGDAADSSCAKGVIFAVLRGLAQVYFASDWFSGLIIAIALTVVGSPVIGLGVLAASGVGVAVGTLLGAPPSELMAGVWGSNAALTAAAVLLHHRFSLRTAIEALGCAATAALLQVRGTS